LVFEGMRTTGISDRSFARYRRALRLYTTHDLDLKRALEAAGRPSGSMNMSMFEQLAEGTVAARLADG
jgi:hypothetical protein